MQLNKSAYLMCILVFMIHHWTEKSFHLMVSISKLILMPNHLNIFLLMIKSYEPLSFGMIVAINLKMHLVDKVGIMTFRGLISLVGVNLPLLVSQVMGLLVDLIYFPNKSSNLAREVLRIMPVQQISSKQ